MNKGYEDRVGISVRVKVRVRVRVRGLVQGFKGVKVRNRGLV